MHARPSRQPRSRLGPDILGGHWPCVLLCFSHASTGACSPREGHCSHQLPAVMSRHPPFLLQQPHLGGQPTPWP